MIEAGIFGVLGIGAVLASLAGITREVLVKTRAASERGSHGRVSVVVHSVRDLWIQRRGALPTGCVGSRRPLDCAVVSQHGTREQRIGRTEGRCVMNPLEAPSETTLPDVVLVQTAVGDYRQRVLTALVDSLGDRFSVLAGDRYFEPSLTTSVDLGPRLERVTNHFLVGRRILWQQGVVLRGVRADVAILELNPRVISMLLTLLLRRLAGKKTVLWGHATSRAGRRRVSDAVRVALWRMATVVLMYTPEQAQDVAARAPRVKVHHAPNALYLRSETAAESCNPRGFVFVGRLTPAKKPLLALEAFLQVQRRLGRDARLVFVGEGPLRADVEDRVLRSRAEARVRLLGHVSDVSALRELYSSALASLSPGCAGLSIIQSFSFGVPVGIARDEPHGPELDATREGDNAIFFRSDDPAALGETLLAFSHERDAWIDRRRAIWERCVEVYSVEAMTVKILASITDCEQRDGAGATRAEAVQEGRS